MPGTLEFCLADIGLLLPEDTDPKSKGVFRHEKRFYRLIFERGFLMHQVPALLRDVKRLPEYSLRWRTDASDEASVFLSLFMRFLRPEELGDFGCVMQRQRMVALFFRELERRDFVRMGELQLRELTGDGEPLSVNEFYERLRVGHEGEVLDGSIPEDVAHGSLRPTLRPYQVRAIRWMLDRETVPKVLPAQYARLGCLNVEGEEFYMNLDSFEVLAEVPGENPVPPGGILADEMGMGKTVEMLGLMLLNRNRKRKFEEEVGPGVAVAVKELKCICIRSNVKDTISCQKCGQRQHKKCVLKNCEEEPTRYICPECWRSEALVESSTTIIVSPVSIKMQWASEIRKHIADSSFKIFIYEGVAESGWISPADLAKYDVVLTDYNVLQTEIYYTAVNSRTSRHGKRFLSPVSPLPLVRWWRVCLDEAQMVEGIHNQTTKMVKTLPAVHRWTVTGTPIEKSMDNLYGLVHFLDYSPYNDYQLWRQLNYQYQQGNPRPLLAVMSRIMWRTCKAAVLDQLGIPPQTEVLHKITMSDLQNFFYRTEHAKCATAFREKAAYLGRNLSMARMTIQTLNLLMEPLRKLRQDCVIPSILHKSDQLTTKKLLTPNELREHLVLNNEMECKSALRTIVSSINGMAAVHVIRREYEQAAKLYKSALRWADDYQGTISVDSLLQIHALYNLIEVLEMNGFVGEEETFRKQLRDYEERCAKLEWKYIETYSNIVKNVERELAPAAGKVFEISAKLDHKVDGNWWRDVIFSLDRNSAKTAAFLLKLNVEVKNHSGMAEDIVGLRSMDYQLTTWLDEVKEQRNELVDAFDSIAYFRENLKPKHLWPAEVRGRIEALIRTAFLCHLDPELPDLPYDERQERPTCVLCKVKRTLNLYECMIFQKHFIEETNTTEGSWQMTVQEVIVRQIHACCRKERMEKATIEEGNLFLAYLEALKDEFKHYSKYWVEINYAAAAFDELNMCRSRLQVITMEDLDQAGGKKSIQQILDYEVHETFEDLQVQKVTAEREFVRLKGTLKYLQHLGSVAEIDVCPICQCQPEEKYAVLQCGHHFCIVCAPQLVRIARSQGNNVTCGVCRHKQQIADLYFVTCGQIVPAKQDINVRGNYSNKILKIVETVLQLKLDEPDVKIIIFSHWDPILFYLAQALDTNSVTYRLKSAKFYKHIEEFKDYTNGITCLLLPLKAGSKGLNLTEATHVFLVEPILNPGEELQAVGRVHRIGQTKPTFVHRFIVQNTIEETIHRTVQADRTGRWSSKDVTVEHLEQLFQLEEPEQIELFAE
ncbi:hypothetical protein quinque_005159 [Culex quinquefasciatus]